MVKVDLLILVLTIVGIFVIGSIVTVGVRRWRETPHRVHQTYVAPDLTEWRDRLDQLHFLLLQITGSDGTLAQLPQLPKSLSDELRRYFHGSTLPPVPNDASTLVNRVTRLEELLVEVQRAHRAADALSPLPRDVVAGMDRYLDERRRRLLGS